MHQQFLAQLQNVRVANADTVLRAFYHQTEQTWRGKPTGKPWPFWEARVEELVKHKHRPASSGPFAWRCKHCGQPHEVARREDYATFRCPSLTEVAS
jgi:ribosomal protein S14